MLKKVLTALFMVGLLSAASCSSLVESTRKSLLGSDSPRKSDQEVKWVSKAQYDALMDKYKTLNDKYEKLKDESLASGSGGSQMDELAGAGPTAAETVDVFAKNGLADQASQSGQSSRQNTRPEPVPELSARGIEQELEYYRKAKALKANGKTPQALKIFQYLERSSTEQVRVRARAHIGDIYMSQGQYDLALQVYEAIIKKDAFSGKVLQALKGAVAASAKLDLTQKKMKYQSILKDFFEIES